MHFHWWKAALQTICLIGDSEGELQDDTTISETVAGAYGMEVSPEKSKFLVNSMRQNSSKSIVLNGGQLQTLWLHCE